MRERIAGLGFLVVLAALLGLCVAAYAKVFTPVVGITVHADTAGLQMSKGADVKLHGVLVGEVRAVESTGDGAVLTLGLDPVAAARIPAGVTARLLPKTVFGEKYVELVPPADPTGEPIAEHTVIEVDRSQAAVELGEVLDGALPLLRAVPPEKLAVTLTSVADALDGRGDRLGETFVKLGDVVRQLNDEMPAIEADLELLAAVLDEYTGALPDLITVLENLTITNRTVVEQSDQLKSLWMSTADFGDDTRIFLDRYQGRLIQFAEVTEPFLEVLAAYSPQYPCLFQGLTALEPAIVDSFSGGRLHITLEITRDNGKYEPGMDEPAWATGYGPDCRGLPDPQTPGVERQFANGYDYATGRVNLPINIPGLTDALDYADPSDAATGTDTGDGETDTGFLPFDPRMGYGGTEEEKQLIVPLVAAATGVDATRVSDTATLLWGPLLRGNTVSVR
ncbi:phospholipid/cholesterol/gamma-HCH transport system substrate-binding protein [Stackebrandtia albiflava]|uniref:Phospholipid/cholesterol/gamma-HCH transport system substrate-binding protein n=1 Tax=Stackebrandtia albiflava TaxID=406432 RepID=A0A562V353_9ACTN|nr:MCE family protein [Stackebrandtia albiflava]TWJ12285.1 phospholipid/cholesterol/gamma-HCH transport system substrate-binding protein [Stackebrandtia albiflava]